MFTTYIHCVWYGRELLCLLGECLLDTYIVFGIEGNYCLVGECLLDTELCLVWKEMTVSCG